MSTKGYRWAGPSPLPADTIAEMDAEQDGQNATYHYETDAGGRLLAVSGTPSLAAVETDLDELGSKPIDFDSDQDIYQALGLALVRAAPEPAWSALSLSGRGKALTCVCSADGQDTEYTLGEQDLAAVAHGIGVLGQLIRKVGGGSWSGVRYIVDDGGGFAVEPL